MFSNTPAFSGFSVRDSDEAKKFYTDVLGLAVDPVEGMEDEGLQTLHLSGGTDVLMYPKPDHTPASFTVLNFAVDDIDAAVDELSSKGVQLVRYDQFSHDDKGIVRGVPAVAWFTDPSGNTIGVLQER